MLQKLEVTNNDLQCLPASIGELHKLECLYAQHNDIRELPSFAGCEVAIKEIHISNNFITELPDEFCENLSHLKILDLRDNKIERLPDKIAHLQALMRLDLSNNSINSLPDSLAQLGHLMSLQLDGNPIRSIRRDVLQGGTVRIMKMLRDRCRQQPNDEAVKVKSAAHIGADDDSTFPDQFQMRKSRALTAVGKSLTDVPDSVLQLAQEEQVATVDLSKNKLATVPDG